MMSKKHNQLLYMDLSGRIPYEPFALIVNRENERRQVKITDGNITNIKDINNRWLISCKPYLFPLSSITEEQFELFVAISGIDSDIDTFRQNKKIDWIGSIDISVIADVIDFFHKYHFDYRGLIELGLAIDATGLKIYE